jgi:hypothetical protein
MNPKHPPVLQEAIATLMRLPKSPTVDDFEVVVWDRVSPVNGRSPAQATAVMVDSDNQPCGDAVAVHIREKSSGLVFLRTWTDPANGKPLHDPAAVARAVRLMTSERLPIAPTLDPRGPAEALICAVSEQIGMPPEEVLAAATSIFGGPRPYTGATAVAVPELDPSSPTSGPSTARAIAAIAAQPAPKRGYGDMWRQLIDRLLAREQIDDATAAAMEARRTLGVEKYGTPLQAGNGRNVLADLEQELLDALVYSEQTAEEHPELVREIRGEWQTSLLLLLERVRSAFALVSQGDASSGR